MESFPSKNEAAKPLGVPDRGSDEPRLNGPEQRLRDKRGQIVTRTLDQLRPHPSYVRNHLTVPAAKLSALAEQGEEAFREPLVITRDRFVLDGYAALELARRQGRPTLLCIEFDMNETEGLRWLLWKSRQSSLLNAFSRILLALDLQPGLKERARSNQRAGGQNKGSSKLTEAESVDVRSEVARAAGVCVANVTKVKQLLKTQSSKLQEALRTGQIRIHKAWQWRQLSPERQLGGTGALFEPKRH